MVCTGSSHISALDTCPISQLEIKHTQLIYSSKCANNASMITGNCYCQLQIQHHGELQSSNNCQ